MLAADMRKEGLRGKTLTLKLKTASFEVLDAVMSQTMVLTSQLCIMHYALVSLTSWKLAL